MSRASPRSPIACSPCMSASASPRASPEEVMNDETVRRVYLGGALTTAARPESAFKRRGDAVPRGRESRRLLRHARRRWRMCRSTCIAASSSPSSASTAPARRRCSTPSPASCPIAGDIRREGQSLRGRSAAAIARGGIVQSPEGRELFTDMTVARKPRHGRPAAQGQRTGAERLELAVRSVPAPEGARRRRPPARCPAASSRC